VSAEQLAQEACSIEIEILGHPIGKQDQYAAAYGGLNFIRFNDDESVNVTPIIMKPEVKQKLSRKLLFFYTGLGSRSDIILTEQRKNTETNLTTLRRIVQLAEDLRDALHGGDLTQFGRILHEGWQYKRKLASNVTNALIDSYYETAIAAGALGGKLLGSGGGGFLCFYCDEERQDKVKQALSNLRTVDFCFEPEGSRIIYVSD
jgi:D-glycero-alpha-D-manno-heptose-7-phosphate kinase